MEHLPPQQSSRPFRCPLNDSQNEQRNRDFPRYNSQSTKELCDPEQLGDEPSWEGNVNGRGTTTIRSEDTPYDGEDERHELIVSETLNCKGKGTYEGNSHSPIIRTQLADNLRSRPPSQAYHRC